ncbi:MAG: hypothetical protein WDM79_02540 [Terricaulis sp.]
MPATIAAAPNNTKQPMITVMPWRQFIRPVSIMKPTMATAITRDGGRDIAEQRSLDPVDAGEDWPRALRVGLIILRPCGRRGAHGGERGGEGKTRAVHGFCSGAVLEAM